MVSTIFSILLMRYGHPSDGKLLGWLTSYGRQFSSSRHGRVADCQVSSSNPLALTAKPVISNSRCFITFLCPESESCSSSHGAHCGTCPMQSTNRAHRKISPLRSLSKSPVRLGIQTYSRCPATEPIVRCPTICEEASPRFSPVLPTFPGSVNTTIAREQPCSGRKSPNEQDSAPGIGKKGCWMSTARAATTETASDSLGNVL